MLRRGQLAHLDYASQIDGHEVAGKDAWQTGLERRLMPTVSLVNDPPGYVYSDLLLVDDGLSMLWPVEMIGSSGLSSACLGDMK